MSRFSCCSRLIIPLHFFVFKQVASHLAHEANVEQVFSRAGSLTNPNMDPNFLAALVMAAVNKNPLWLQSKISTMSCIVAKVTLAGAPSVRTMMPRLKLQRLRLKNEPQG